MDDRGADGDDRDDADPLEGVSHPVTPVGLSGSNLDRDEVEERERDDLEPGDGHRHPGGGTMPERDQRRGDQNCDEAREMLRLDERLERPGRRIDAEVVEDGQVEREERKESSSQAEQEPGRMP